MSSPTSRGEMRGPSVCHGDDALQRHPWHRPPPHLSGQGFEEPAPLCALPGHAWLLHPALQLERRCYTTARLQLLYGLAEEAAE